MTTTPFVTATDSLSTAPSNLPMLGRRTRRVAWTDGLGMLASIGCAIHCAAMPFVIAYLPALGLSFLAGELFHQAMAIACFVIALAAFLPGLRKHGSLKPIMIGGVGVSMLSVAAFGWAGECCPSCEEPPQPNVAVSEEACCPDCESPSEAECVEPTPSASVAKTAGIFGAFLPWITPLGGITLVLAHLVNHRLGCANGCCPDNKTTSTEKNLA